MRVCSQIKKKKEKRPEAEESTIVIRWLDLHPSIQCSTGIICTTDDEKRRFIYR